MYQINEHLSGKTTARYPEDFPALTNGKRFVAWKIGEDWHIQTVMTGEELIRMIKALQEKERTK